jgi:hypothetical protein
VKLEYAMLLIALAMVVMLVVYIRSYRNHPVDEFVPVAAHLRAGIFFCFCYLLSYASGTMESILAEPLYTPGQIADPAWRWWMLSMLAFILVAYWLVWARFTIRFERQLELVPQALYGFVWGTAFGQLFLSCWHIAAMIGPDWATWQVWLLTYVTLSIWQWLLMDMYWDIYISPEHDTAYSIALKVPTTHVPNVTLGLTIFAIYENHAIFIAFQCLALVGCSIAMRMPSPWCKKPTLAARRGPSMFFGWPRCVGYLSTDPANDPYLKQAHLPR